MQKKSVIVKPLFLLIEKVNMKKYIVALCSLCMVVVYSCKKDETPAPPTPPPPAKLIISGISDSAIIGAGQSRTINTNTKATWSINKPTGGTFSGNTFNASTNDGVYYLKAKNDSIPTDSLVYFVIVTKHATVFNAMKAGGYVMSFRHADATLGSDQFSSPDPAWWKSCNSSLARQLTNPKGYLQSDSTGTALKRLGIRFDSSYTSEYCRCKQTLERFALTGVPMREVKEITYYVYDENNRYGNTMNFYQTRPITNKNYVSVIHAGFSGVLPTLAPLNSLQWGDACIFKVFGNGTAARLDATVTTNDFMMIARD